MQEQRAGSFPKGVHTYRLLEQYFALSGIRTKNPKTSKANLQQPRSVIFNFTMQTDTQIKVKECHTHATVAAILTWTKTTYLIGDTLKENWKREHGVFQLI